jgi:hypothetical protein
MSEKSLLLNAKDFPENVRVIFKNNIQSSLILKAIKKCKTVKKLSQILNVDYTTIFKWRAEKSFMRVYYLKKLLTFLNLSWKEVSKYIIGVKGEGPLKVYFKRKLPFEIPIKIIAHLQGDGCITAREGRCKYKNQEKILVDSFIKEVLKVFDLHYYTFMENNNYVVELPSVLGKILISKFGSFKSKEFKVPNIKSKENMKLYLQALFDDEGYIVNDKENKAICIELYNGNALKHVQKFLMKFGIASRIFKTQLWITKYSNVKLFAKEIGFSHPLQKEKLKKLLKSYKSIAKKKAIERRKRKIIELLTNYPKSTDELLKHFRICKRTLQYAIYALIKENKIYRIKKKNNVFFKVIE